MCDIRNLKGIAIQISGASIGEELFALLPCAMPFFGGGRLLTLRPRLLGTFALYHRLFVGILMFSWFGVDRSGELPGRDRLMMDGYRGNVGQNCNLWPLSVDIAPNTDKSAKVECWAAFD